MATNKDYIAYLEDCLQHIPEIRFRAMFGGYTLYCCDVPVGLVDDNTLYIKVNIGTTPLLAEKVKTGPPYPGGKEAYILTEAEFEDKPFIAQVITAGRDALAKKLKPAGKVRPKK